jgi:hypothetical protein
VFCTKKVSREELYDPELLEILILKVKQEYWKVILEENKKRGEKAINNWKNFFRRKISD